MKQCFFHAGGVEARTSRRFDSLPASLFSSAIHRVASGAQKPAPPVGIWEFKK
jgi:hypothetical protein